MCSQERWEKSSLLPFQRKDLVEAESYLFFLYHYFIDPYISYLHFEQHLAAFPVPNGKREEKQEREGIAGGKWEGWE